MLGEVGWMWSRMFKSLQLYYTAWHGLFCLHCCCCFSALCFKPSIQAVYFFLKVLVTSLGPSPQSITQCQQTFPCFTVCLVWPALEAREFPMVFPYKHSGIQTGEEKNHKTRNMEKPWIKNTDFSSFLSDLIFWRYLTISI